MFERIYAVYDLKAEAVFGGALILSAADGAAARTFDDMLRDQRTLVGQHPEDFNLLCVGEFRRGDDGRVGVCSEIDVVLSAPVPHRVVVRGADVVAEARRQAAATGSPQFIPDVPPEDHIA